MLLLLQHQISISVTRALRFFESGASERAGKDEEEEEEDDAGFPHEEASGILLFDLLRGIIALWLGGRGKSAMILRRHQVT